MWCSRPVTDSRSWASTTLTRAFRLRDPVRGPRPTPDDYNRGETGIAVVMCQVACVAYRSIGSEG